MFRRANGAETLRGFVSAASDGLLLVAGDTKREPIDTLRRRPVVPSERRGGSAREETGRKPGSRRSQEGPGRVENPGEHPAVRPANHTPFREGLSEGSKPRSRALAGRVAAPATTVPTGETAGGFIRAETSRRPFERGTLRRVNPRSAVGAKQTRRGPEGVSRQEGSQTLKAERSGAWKPRDQVDFRTRKCCREQESKRGAGSLQLARVRWARL